MTTTSTALLPLSPSRSRRCSTRILSFQFSLSKVSCLLVFVAGRGSVLHHPCCCAPPIPRLLLYPRRVITVFSSHQTPRSRLNARRQCSRLGFCRRWLYHYAVRNLTSTVRKFRKSLSTGPTGTHVSKKCLAGPEYVLRTLCTRTRTYFYPGVRNRLFPTSSFEKGPGAQTRPKTTALFPHDSLPVWCSYFAAQDKSEKKALPALIPGAGPPVPELLQGVRATCCHRRAGCWGIDGGECPGREVHMRARYSLFSGVCLTFLFWLLNGTCSQMPPAESMALAGWPVCYSASECEFGSEQLLTIGPSISRARFRRVPFLFRKPASVAFPLSPLPIPMEVPATWPQLPVRLPDHQRKAGMAPTAPLLPLFPNPKKVLAGRQ